MSVRSATFTTGIRSRELISDNDNRQPTAWVRPTSWPAFPSISSTDQKLIGLFAVYPNLSVVSLLAVTSTGTYTVDWGDGVSETFTSNTVAEHTYDYTDPDLDSGTVADFGYKTAYITVTATTANLTTVDLYRKNSLTNLQNGYSANWLDVAVAGSNLTNITICNGTNVRLSMLERFRLLSCSTSTTAITSFYECTNLRKVEFSNDYRHTSGSNMFYYCANLQEAPELNTTNMTTTANMFQQCGNLLSVPAYDLRACTSASAMFQDCRSIRNFPLMQFDNSLTNVSSMFRGCLNLKYAPFIDTQSVTNFSSMFQECRSLIGVPTYDTRSATNMSSMFYECRALQQCPFFDTRLVTNMSAMFYNCSALRTIPLLDTANNTTMAQMFFTCNSLQEIPLISTAKVTTFSEAFRNCTSLETIPALNTSNSTTFANMFNGCWALETVPNLTSTLVTTTQAMFSNCYALTSVGNMDLSNVTTAFGMFELCTSLRTAPSLTFGAAKLDNVGGMFSSAFSLTTVPTYVTNAVTNWNNVFQNARSINYIGSWNLNGNNSDFNNQTVQGCLSLQDADIYNIKRSITFNGIKANKTFAEKMCNNTTSYAGTSFGGGNITFASTPAATNASLPRTATFTTGGTTLTVNSATNIAVDNFVTGLSVSTTRAVTFQDTGDTVTLTAHGIPNDTPISFSVITTTTGISTRTIYYVVNAATDTFQVASTVGGAALPLTTNGSGTLVYLPKVTNVSGTTITINIPVSGNGTSQAVTFVTVNIQPAYLRGFSVSF